MVPKGRYLKTQPLSSSLELGGGLVPEDLRLLPSLPPPLWYRSSCGVVAPGPLRWGWWGAVDFQIPILRKPRPEDPGRHSGLRFELFFLSAPQAGFSV